MNKAYKKTNTAIEGGIAYFAAIVAYLLFSLIFGLIMPAVRDNPTTTAILVFVEGVLISISFAAVAKISQASLQSYPLFRPEKTGRSAFFVVPIVAALCIFGFQWPALLFEEMLLTTGYTVRGLLDFNDPLTLTFSIIRVIAIAPFCEEYLMRGSVLSSLVRVTDRRGKAGNIIAAVALNGMLFALLHMNPVQTIYQFFFGCVLAFITIMYGSILPAVALHILNNAVAVVLSIPAVSELYYSSITAFLMTWPGILVSILAPIAAGALIIAFVTRIRKAEIPDPTKVSGLNDGYRKGEDDGGALVSMLFYVSAIIITVALWIAVLIGGYAA